MLRALFLLALFSSTLGGSPATTSLEDFESFFIADGQAAALDVTVLDEHTIANGQGPGLVGPGCLYSGTGLQWNGKGYYGQTSRNLQADGNLLLLSYITPVASFDFNLSVFDGYPDTAYVNVFTPQFQPITTLGPISLADGTPVPVSYSGNNIGYVQVVGSNYSWSPMIDDHAFGQGSYDLDLTVGGVPGSTMTFDVTGATPSGLVALCYAFGNGSHTAYNPYTGNTITTGLSSSNFTMAYLSHADGAGTLGYSSFVPGAAMGLVYVQAFDVSTDGTSNVAGL